MLELIHEPLERIATVLHERRISILELTKFCIDRTQALSQQVNAMNSERFSDALSQAKAWDEDLSRRAINRQEKPLLGIPFVVSANIGIAGMRKDMGSWLMHGSVSKSTATVVNRLMTAGAIPLCLGNIGELGLGSETTNPIYGRTQNPWRKFRSPGGSNGGTAALVAAGACAFGIANDFAASLRIPAAFCGLYGHKPTRGVVPLTGQYPFSRPEDEISWRALDGIGTLTHSARDAQLLLEVIAGPCALDPMSMTGSLQSFDGIFTHRRVGVLSNPKVKGARSIRPEIRLAIHKASQLMQEAGAELFEIPEDLFWDACSLWNLTVHRATEGRLKPILSGNKISNSKVELLKVLLGQSDHSLGSCLQMFREDYQIDPDRLRELESDMSRLRQRLDQIFAKASIILLPTFPSATPRHFFSLTHPNDTGLSCLINALGYPATTAPMGVSGDGLPVAVQVMAPLGCDAMTISAAKIIGNFIPPNMPFSPETLLLS